MTHIRWIEEPDATGELAEVYRAWRAANPHRDTIPDILRAMSQRPELLRGMIRVSDEVQFCDGHLTQRQKEMIATFVSGLNQCPY